ncbi:hypothetical protein NGB36_16160 [Streptomyces sp. RB6PN25]|uniref:Uncharacterized protein n=1 Tax=Streptomyces humicola TaxID=2953240 RepID=A0ABT1PWR0_9ACTN|nr:hypothetical protein [Streptomyces humicola]MCQ4082101.1 hypothetical protein [Streptomyces humicola]
MTTARPWRRRGQHRGQDHRAAAQAAKDAAAQAFYELDTAQREVRISVETITAVDASPAGRRAGADLQRLERRIDEVSAAYIAAVDEQDLDSVDLDLTAATHARNRFTLARDEILRVSAELDRFARSIAGVLARAETELARLAPAVERARASLREAAAAVDAVRTAGFAADGHAARLAALGPELPRPGQGAVAHGVPETIRRADDVRRAAEEIRAETERLPQQAAEIDKRLVSLRTRAEALATRAEQVGPVLSELRRRFSARCWQDLQEVPDRAVDAAERAGHRLGAARAARDAERWQEASAGLAEVRELLAEAEADVAAAGDRLRGLDEVSRDPQAEIEKTRFALRDAQRLAMQDRSTPDPRHARPLDEAAARLDRAVGALTGRHPDYWAFLTETEAIRTTADDVVQTIRGERASHWP